MKGLYCGIFLVLISFGISAQTITSTTTGGNWNSTTTWLGGVIPDYSNSSSIVIAGPVTVPNGYSVIVDQLTINVSRTLTVALGGTLTLQDEGTASNELTFQTGFGNAILNVNGRFIVGDRATVANATGSRLKILSTGVYEHRYTDTPGTIYVSGWSSGSTLIISGYTAPGGAPSGLNQAFYNVLWDCPNQADFIDLDGGLVTILGDLVISNTNSNFLVFTQSTNYVLNITGDLEVEGTSSVAFNGFVPGTTSTINIADSLIYTSDNDSWLSVDGTSTLTVQNDFVVNSVGSIDFVSSTGASTINLENDFRLISGELKNSGLAATADIRFNGTMDAQMFVNTGTITEAINFAIQNGAIVDFTTYAATGSGGFTLEAGATMKVGSTDGLVVGTGTGNVRVSGTRTYVDNGNIIYNSSSAQNLGNEWGSGGALNGVAVNLEIANTNAAGVTNNIIGATSLVGNLVLTSNPLHIGNSNTLIIQSNFTATNGTIGGLSTSNLTFSGSGTITGNLNFAAGSQSLNTLTISRDATIPLGTPLTITGTLAFTEPGELRFYDQTLTINGDITQTGGGASGGMESNASSNLVIGGTGPLSSLPFVNASQLNDLTLGRTSGGTYTLASAVTINGTLSLNAGTFTHNSGLIMANGSTFARSAGASLTANAPNASGSYNVSYTGALTTGLELPSIASALNNLTVAGDAALDKQVTINGDLTINSGTLSAGAFSVTMAGANFLVNGGAFTINPASTVTFSRAGITTLGGTTVAGTQFGNLTINSGATLSAPNASINVSGTWDNLGTFTPNSGTVAFNGTDQSINGNGQPFNNLVFANSGTKSLDGDLDVNGSLTINTGVTLDAVSSDNDINVGGTWANAGTFTASGNTVIFDGGAQTITETGSFHNLTLAGSNTKTLGGAVDINNTLAISSGVTFTTASQLVTIGGNWTNDGTFTAGSTGLVIFNGISTIGGTSTTRFRNINIAGTVTAAPAMEVAGNWLYSSGVFNANSGTVTFNGSANQSITSGGQPFSTVVIGGTNIKTIQDNLDINGNLVLNGATFDVGLDRTVTIAGNFDASGGGILDANAGSFTFDGAAQTITSGGEAFFNIAISGTNTKTLADALDVNGSVDLNSTLAAGANNITVGGNWDATGGTFSTTGTTTFDGSTQSILTNGSAFATLNIAGSGTKTLLGTLDVNDDLTISSTLDVSASNFAVVVGGNWDASAGTFTAQSGLVTLDGAAQNISTGLSGFNNLTVAGSGEKTQLSALQVNGNLSINSGAGLNAGADFGITLTGNLTTDGTYTPASSTLVLNGTAGQSISGASATNFYDLTIDKSSGTAVISSSQNLINALTMVAGTLNANGMLTLVSSATGDARIAEIPGGASITGNIIAQRYLPNSANMMTYRYLASPVTGAFVSDWKAEFPITGTFNDPSTQAEWPGLPVTQANPSLFRYNEAQPGLALNDRYESYPLNGTTSTASSIENGLGYAAYVRQKTPVTINLTGVPRQGDVPVNVTAQSAGGDDGWNLVGNPYASPINWDNVTRPAGVNAQIALMDNLNIMGLGSGEYVYYTQNGIGIPASYDGTVASGQAFWIRATSNSTITFQENDKQPVSDPDFIRQIPLRDIIRINIAGNNRQDETVIHFNADASDEADANFDAFKLKNDYINFSSLSSDSVKMAINVLSSISCSKEIGLVVEGVTPGSYAMNFSEFETFNDIVEIRLLDTFTGTNFDVRVDGPVYQFTVSTDQNTFGKHRFKLYLTYPEVATDLLTLGEDVCSGTDARITIQDSQEGVKYYSTINGSTVSEEVVGNGNDIYLTISKDKLAEGENALVVMAAMGGCSAVPLENSVALETEKIYAITSANSGKSCGEGQVVLSAEGAPGDGYYSWYESIDSTSPIAGQNGAEFVTPVLNKTKTYFVSAVNSLGCEGDRVEVAAEISYFEEVAITVDEQKLTSSYETGNQWFFNGESIANATGQSVTISETGLYEVEVTINGCSTRASQEMIVMSAEYGAGMGYHFYPNPVEGILQIELPETGPARGTVQSPVGAPIGNLKFELSGGKMRGEFNFEHQSAGLYLLRVLQGNKIIHYKIIKK